MKQTLTICLILLLCIQHIFSLPIDQNKALNIAEEFFHKQDRKLAKGTTDNSLSLVYACTDIQTKANSNAVAYYYVFNKSNNQGFIIVSGDDRAKPILGYTEAGAYNPEDLPENFKFWMNYYKEEIKDLMTQEESLSKTFPFQSSSSSTFDAAIAPLLKDISWNQSAPYNNICPMDGSSRSVTGCVATAMAQIMRYHRWPEQGKGSKSYRTPLGTSVSVDFSQSTYDWDHMTERYSSSSTAQEEAAVAKLMYDCGAAVEMQYSSQASGAYSTDVPEALKQYFDYDANIQYHNRKYYLGTDWIKLIKTELNSSRPIYFSAQSSSVGHAFVCDGYDTNNLFHINWGWGGTSNGYFEIATLNPQEQGIGGGAGGYSINQAIITGIQKPNPEAKATYVLCTGSELTSSSNSTGRNGAFTVSANRVINYGLNTFSGEMGIGLFQNDEWIATYANTSLTLGSYRVGGYSWKDIKIPNEISDGFYHLYVVYRGSNETEWRIVNSAEATISNYLELTVSTNLVTLTNPLEGVSMMSIPREGFQIVGNVYKNRNARFNLHIENAHKEIYTSLGIILESVGNPQINGLVCYEGITIPKDGEISLELTGAIPFEPGEYTAYVVAMQGYSWVSIGGESILPVTILATPAAARLSLTEGLSMNQRTFTVDGNETATVSTSVKNTGGFYGDKLYAFIFRSGESSSSNYVSKDTFIDGGETINIQFNKTIDLEEGNYSIRIAYVNSNSISLIGDTKNQISFKVEGSTGIDDNGIGKTIIYPNPADRHIQIQSEETIKAIHILTVSGKQVLTEYPDTEFITIPVENFSSGGYFIRIETTGGIETQKFIKK